MRTLLTDLRGNPITIPDRRSSRPHGRTTLMQFVQTMSWNDVVRRAKSHEPEMWMTDEQGSTPLHIACKFDPPVSVIHALSASVTASNANGLTPLHVAASHRCNARTLTALVEMYPASLRTTSRRERTPMHYACLSFRGLDIRAFEILLEASSMHSSCEDGANDADADDTMCMDHMDQENKADVVLAWKDSTGCTPLGLLFRRYRERVKNTISRLNQDTAERAEEVVLLQSDLGQLWDKARVVVAKLTEERLQREASFLECEEDSSLAWAVEQQLLGECKFRIVHASVGLVGYGCPPELIRLAIALHPEQVKEMDEEGNLPLHIAVTASSAHSRHSTHSSFGANNNDDESSVFSITSFFSNSTVNKTPHAFDKVIQILLRQYPSAARIPHGRSGRLPLVSAIRAGERTWEDGIQTLLLAHPTALHSARLGKLYPHALALIAGTRPTLTPVYREGGAESGPRILQNLYLLAINKRVGRFRGDTRPRKSRSLVSSSHGSRSKRSEISATPKVLSLVYLLLRSKPEMLDSQKSVLQD